MNGDCLIKTIKEDIERCYESYEKPKFFFINKAMDNKIWDDLINELKLLFIIEDITDANSDVSRVINIDYGNSQKATIQLSFVGNYAVVFRHEAIEGNIFLSSKKDAFFEDEKVIIDYLHKYKLKILNINILYTPLKLKLFDADNVRIYQGLFTDVEFIPGEYVE